MNLNEKVSELLSDLEKYEESVKEILYEEIEEYVWILEGVLQGTESPIERMMAITLDRIVNTSYLQKIGDVFDLYNQSKIKINDEITYRVDFLLVFSMQETGFTKKFVVECDGHDYHERTKEQATRDKERDRRLMDAGYYVIRFSGSEIFKDPYKCARQVRDIITKKVINEAFRR